MYVSLSDAKELALILEERTGVGYSRFSTPFFRRRLSSVCEQLNVKKRSQLEELLDQPDFADQMVFHMAVPASEMFRDPGFWRSLRHALQQRITEAGYKIWFPDATSGEEVYSLLIMLNQIGLLNKTVIHVQHAGQTTLDEIKSGVIPGRSMKLNQSNFERLETKDDINRFFDEAEKNYVLKTELLRNVTFHKGWFMDTQPAEKFQLIFFRNSGLVLDKGYQEEGLSLLIDKLAKEGVITIGIKENMPTVIDDLVASVNLEEGIFEKVL